MRKRIRLSKGTLEKEKENSNISGVKGAFIREADK